MSGKIKIMIDDIIRKRAGGSSAVAHLTRAKLIMKGINPDKFSEESPDDPQVISQLIQVADELGISL